MSLLAALDPYTMGFRRRARLLNPDRQDLIYDRGGNATSVALVDGQVAGVWDVLTPSGEMGFFPFDTLTSPVTNRVEAELARLGSFFTGTTAEVQWVGQMVPLTDRRAGWVLKPLHDPSRLPLRGTFLNSGTCSAIIGRRRDRIELFPQPSDQIVWVWAVISIDDCRDGEYAGVREDVKVDGGIASLGNRNRKGGTHLMAAKSHRLHRTADVCHERMEAALVVHIKAVAPKPCEKPEQPTENRDGRRTGRSRLVGTHRRLNPRETFAYAAIGRDIDEHRTYEIAHFRVTSRASARHRHSDDNRIDVLTSAQQNLVERCSYSNKDRILGRSSATM